MEIEQYTICLYGEYCGTYKPIGSGILIKVDGQFYLVSAHHVFDREEERLQIENDPDEYGIDHDDTDSVFIRVAPEYDAVDFYIVNDCMTGIVCEVHSNKEGVPVFNDDIEYVICALNDCMVKMISDSGKLFYNADSLNTEYQQIVGTVIISGYPLYAIKNDVGGYRTFKCKASDNIQPNESCLFRVLFDNHDAYNFEKSQIVLIPGVKGMSGVGMWMIVNDILVPIAIILKQDPNNGYVEGYRLNQIITDIKTNKA